MPRQPSYLGDIRLIHRWSELNSTGNPSLNKADHPCHLQPTDSPLARG
jgi:hypothetical protein